MSDFWRAVAEHPAVAPHMGLEAGDSPDWWTPLLAHPSVRVIEGEHGGYFLAQMDPLGRVYELHAAITPEGWGKAASDLLKGALSDLAGWDVVLACEVEGNWRSRPPKSFGFRPTGPFQGQFRTWVLTRDAWERSPARRRMG